MKTKSYKYISPVLTVSMVLLIGMKMYWGKCLYVLVGQNIPTQGLDNTLWLFHFTGLSTFLVSNIYIAYCIDFVLISSFLLFIFYQNRGYAAFVLAIYLLHTFTYQIFSGHFHKLDVIIALILFGGVWQDKQRQLVWEGIRYFLLFVMVSSAFYKLYNGALIFPSHFSNVLMSQHADIGILHSFGITTYIAKILIAYPYLGWAIFAMLFLLQTIFVIGFFTKKYDPYLFGLVLLFVVLDYIIMRIWAWDMLLAAYPLILPYWYSTLQIKR